MFDEVYVEFQILILENFEVNLVSCYFDYDIFGMISNFKLVLLWQVIEDLMICGFVVQGFCVFLIVMLFGGIGDSFLDLQDFCDVNVVNFIGFGMIQVGVCVVQGVLDGFIQLNF